MSFQYFGLSAFRAALDRGLALAEFAERKLRGMPDWEVVTPAVLGIVTFRRRGVEESYYPVLHEAMLTDGFALLSATVLTGRTVLRLCTINPRTTEADIVQTLDWLDGLVPAKEGRASIPPRTGFTETDPFT